MIGGNTSFRKAAKRRSAPPLPSLLRRVAISTPRNRRKRTAARCFLQTRCRYLFITGISEIDAHDGRVDAPHARTDPAALEAAIKNPTMAIADCSLIEAGDCRAQCHLSSWLHGGSRYDLPSSRNDQSGPSHLLERDAFVPPTYATSESSCTDSFCSPAVEFIRQPLWILAQVSKKLGIAMVRRIAANIAKLPEPAR
jgi:hypothetical protein